MYIGMFTTNTNRNATCLSQPHTLLIRPAPTNPKFFGFELSILSALYQKFQHTDISNLKRLKQIELQAKLLNYFLGSNKSKINQPPTYITPSETPEQITRTGRARTTLPQVQQFSEMNFTSYFIAQQQRGF